jgi:alkylation response protein AidB-like acyl-CoA dehydrogenase
MAVNYATTIATAVTRDAVQVLGGHGFIADHPVERWYRAAAGLATLDFDPTCSAFTPAL